MGPQSKCILTQKESIPLLKRDSILQLGRWVAYWILFSAILNVTKAKGRYRTQRNQWNFNYVARGSVINDVGKSLACKETCYEKMVLVLITSVFVSPNKINTHILNNRNALGCISDVTFNIGVETFRHAILGCLLMLSSDTRVMDRFVDVVWYDLNGTPERGRWHS